MGNFEVKYGVKMIWLLSTLGVLLTQFVISWLGLQVRITRTDSRRRTHRQKYRLLHPPPTHPSLPLPPLQTVDVSASGLLARTAVAALEESSGHLRFGRSTEACAAAGQKKQKNKRQACPRH